MGTRYLVARIRERILNVSLKTVSILTILYVQTLFHGKVYRLLATCDILPYFL